MADDGIGDDAIRAALDRVLGSPPFRSSKRIRQFLLFVVEETLAGRADSIKAYSIALDCFAREGDFDPQIDPYVRIVARRLRRALKHYYEEHGAGDAVRISVPRGGYVPEFTVAGAVVSALPVVSSRSQGDGSSSGREVLSSTVAIVRLEAHGEVDDREFLASGLTQEIILALSRFAKLVIVGPITAVKQDVRDSSPRDLGRDHDADFVLMGTVHALGGKLRVTVSLTEVASSRVIWAERFDRELTVEGLFEVQDEIARTVAATIGDASGVIVRRSAERAHGTETRRLTSYEAVMRGFHWNDVATPEALEQARLSLEDAVRSDPGYALARALLADIYFTDWAAGVDSLPGALDRAESLAESALEVAPFLGDARWAAAQVHFGRRRFDEFRNGFDAALELNPHNATHLASYALFLVGLEEWDEAAELLALAERLNPHYPTWHHLVPAISAARRGEWEQSLESARRFKAAGLIWGPTLRAMALGHLGRAGEAAGAVDELLRLKPEFARQGRALIARLLCSEGNVSVVLDGLAAGGLDVA